MELREQVAKMQGEKVEVEGRLGALGSGNVRPVSREERQRVEVEGRMVGRCLEARVRIAREMWGIIAEATPKEEWGDLRENLGLEV